MRAARLSGRADKPTESAKIKLRRHAADICGRGRALQGRNGRKKK